MEEPIRVKFSQEVSDFLVSNGNLFEGHWHNFGDFWYKDTDDKNTFEMFLYDELPPYMRSYIDNITPKVCELKDDISELVRHYENLLDDYCRVVYGQGLDGGNRHIKENRMKLIAHLTPSNQIKG